MIVFGVIIIILVLFDQITKTLIEKKLQIGKEVKITPKALRFCSARNNGAALGILSGQKALLTIISSLALIVFSYLLFLNGSFNTNFLYTASLIFLISGTLGNLLCRIIRSKVVDFIIINIGKYSSPIFNIADIYLVMGIILMIIREF